MFVMEVAKYSADGQLRDGRPIVIRALRPDDRANLVRAINRTSAQSRYLRFFGAKRYFTDREISFFTDVDFVNHVALIATANQDGCQVIVGGGRYVVTEPGKAEMAFIVADEFQGQGMGTALLRHLIAIARDTELNQLTAEVLPENTPMLKVFEHSGLPLSVSCTPGVVHVMLRLH